MRKSVVGFLLAISILMTGCTRENNEDYTIEHDDLLDESLGEWRVIEEDVAEVVDNRWYISERQFRRWERRYLGTPDKPSFIPTFTWLKWKLEYTGEDGEKQTFDMDNLNPLEESLIFEAIWKLNQKVNSKMSEGIVVSVEDPYLRFGDLKENELIKHYKEIQKLYGDSLKLQSLGLENSFKETPIYVDIDFNFEEMKKKNESMTKNQFNQFVESEMDKLVEEIPYLNAFVIIAVDNDYKTKVFIQGKEIEEMNEYVSLYQIEDKLQEYFPKFTELELTYEED